MSFKVRLNLQCSSLPPYMVTKFSSLFIFIYSEGSGSSFRTLRHQQVLSRGTGDGLVPLYRDGRLVSFVDKGGRHQQKESPQKVENEDFPGLHGH